jgi:alkylhydroperoxidase/carboxymuconolactone decarboxylase family protein YurZ
MTENPLATLAKIDPKIMEHLKANDELSGTSKNSFHKMVFSRFPLEESIMHSYANKKRIIDSSGNGALSRKIKLLIALAFDAAHGAESGVRALALAAQKEGATPEETGCLSFIRRRRSLHGFNRAQRHRLRTSV